MFTGKAIKVQPPLFGGTYILESWGSLLLLLSCFSRVQLCVTPEMAAQQAPPSLGFSRQEHWSAISFSNAWKWKVKVKSLSHVRLFMTPRTAPYQTPPPIGFSKQEYWSGVPLPSLNFFLLYTNNDVSQRLWRIPYCLLPVGPLTKAATLCREL